MAALPAEQREGALLAGGEGLPEEVPAGHRLRARGLPQGRALLPPGHRPGRPAQEGSGSGLGGPRGPPREESQQAALHVCHLLRRL